MTREGNRAEAVITRDVLCSPTKPSHGLRHLGRESLGGDVGCSAASPTHHAAYSRTECSGSQWDGDKVFPVTLQNGHYNVTWTASGAADGNFEITVHGADSSDLIANTVLNNPYFPGQPTGQSYFAASGGTEYTLEVKGPFAWTISFSPVP